MIVLDTNVISELTRQAPDESVISWLDSVEAQDVDTTAITAAELLYGIAGLPEGARKARLEAAVTSVLVEDLQENIKPFDAAEASQYALVVCDRERAGRPISTSDAQIAAICRQHRATLATRNTADFEGTGIELVNPWKLSEPGTNET